MKVILLKKFLFLILIYVPTLLLAQTPPADFVVVLDAGHGGKDNGNRGNGYYEKNIALNITLNIGQKLEKIKGVKVIYTRKDDRFIELNNRAEIANKADANLFISIHCDAFTSSKAYGAGTFVLGLHRNQDNFRIAQKENSVIFLEEDYESKYDGFDPNNPESVISLVLMQETYLDQSIIAASTIQQSFVKNLKRKDRTVKQAGFLVLRETYMPSVLVEVGFLTNANEGAYLNSSKGQREISNAITEAILSYKSALSSSLATSVSTNTISIDEPEVVTQKDIANTTNENISFVVQIAASSKKIALDSENFNGLFPIKIEQNNGLYRYYYGNTINFDDVLKLKKKAQKRGYEHAFIVAFKNGKKVKLSDVISRN